MTGLNCPVTAGRFTRLSASTQGLLVLPESAQSIRTDGARGPNALIAKNFCARGVFDRSWV